MLHNMAVLLLLLRCSLSFPAVLLLLLLRGYHSLSKAVAVLLLLLLVRTVLLATSSRLGLRGLWLWQVGLLSFLQLRSRWWCLVTLLQLLVCSMLPLCRW